MPAGRTYSSIATTTTTATTSSVTFSSIPQTYTDLVLVITPVLESASYPWLRFNANSGNNYSDIYMNGNPSGAITGGARTAQSRGYIAEQVTHLTDGNAKTNIIVNIMNYSDTTSQKTWFARGNSPYSGTYTGNELIAGKWANTAAVTSITIGTAAGGTDYNLAAGTFISLYGIERA